MNFDALSSNINPIEIFANDALGVKLDQVRLIQTHISWVVLAGAYAYKLKKPVAFPFLDYSSLEKRQQFCCKEMERNRSWAGSLYIDILGLHGDRGNVVLGEPTAGVEWCLRMHQFNQADCLLNQAELGMIPKEWIDDLARHFVVAHSGASIAASDSPWGTAKSLSLQLDQCCLDIEVAARKKSVAVNVQSIVSHLQSQLHHFESLMLLRKQQGFVRECHGDLHLGNLIRWQGHTVGFDAIEFNPDFYWIDVWNDVAFTIMDLDWRDQRENASRLMNAYAEGGADYRGLGLVRLFTAYRALVRARIAALRVHQNAVDSDMAGDSINEMLGYIELAKQYLQSSTPKLWITHGVSGSGKSTGSEQYVEKFRAIRIRTDVERKRLARISRMVTGEQAIYSAEFTKTTYSHCFELARDVVKAGYSVVIDGTFLKHWQREAALYLANELAVEFGILDFEAPIDILRERIRKRVSDPSDATLEVLEQQLAGREPLTEFERRYVRAREW